MTAYAVSSCHHLATEAAQQVLNDGGNIVDASVTAAFVLQVVEPHLNGPAGELVALISLNELDEPLCYSGVGRAPHSASIDRFTNLGFNTVPASGTMTAPVPGQFDALCELLDNFGTWKLESILRPAIQLSKSGFPVTPSLHHALQAASEGLFRYWTDSRDYWLPTGSAPSVGQRLSNLALHATYQQLAKISAQSGSRIAGIQAARDYWYRGPIAHIIAEHASTEHWQPLIGRAPGFLKSEDLASHTTSIENTVSLQLGGLVIHKPGAWSQGPSMLETLGILQETSAIDLNPDEAESIHYLIEAIRLAMADRDAYFGDAYFGDASSSISELLSTNYLAKRGSLITNSAAEFVKAGILVSQKSWVAPENFVAQPIAQAPWDPERNGRGDTCHVSIIDQHGQAISLTASGGWLQSSPTITSLGFPLSTRLQQTWLDDLSPSALKPGLRPRVTLTPTLALAGRGVHLALGTPGGDAQEQWQLHALLRMLYADQPAETAVKSFAFQSISFPNSFWPRESVQRGVLLEEDAPQAVREDLVARGHVIFSTPMNSLGRLSIVRRDLKSGNLAAAVSPRTGYGGATVISV